MNVKARTRTVMDAVIIKLTREEATELREKILGPQPLMYPLYAALGRVLRENTEQSA